MKKRVTLDELQIVVNRFDSSANVGDLVFDGFRYSENKDFYIVYMSDIRTGKEYCVVFRKGTYLYTIEVNAH